MINEIDLIDLFSNKSDYKEFVKQWLIEVNSKFNLIGQDPLILSERLWYSEPWFDLVEEFYHVEIKR